MSDLNNNIAASRIKQAERADRRPKTGLAVAHGLCFVRARPWLVTGLSVALVVPCFWHRQVEAGDFGSHAYNAWLAHLIRHGQAPGLYTVWPWTNVLVDVLLERLGAVVGFANATKLTAAMCVLIFFWGAFALIAAATRQTPWSLVPAIAMITYGWSFQMGFMNYCVSLGLAFFAVALFWRGSLADWVLGLLLTALALLAHAVGFAWLIGTAVYILLRERLHGWTRVVLFAGALLAIIVVHIYVSHHLRTESPIFRRFLHLSGVDQLVVYGYTGVDQLVLYGYRYNKLAKSALLFAVLCYIIGTIRGLKKPELWRTLGTPIELWGMALFATAMLWEQIFFPQHAQSFGAIGERLSSITAVLGLCILGCVRPSKVHFVGWLCIMIVFFSWMYQDTGVLNDMEEQAEMLVHQLPYGTRIVQTIFGPPGSRVAIAHMVDRACIGLCFTYSNYEAPERKFRIRATPGNPIVTDSVDAKDAMERGRYVVQPQDLPMAEIYQCDSGDLTRLCLRELTAGEVNGRLGYLPPRLRRRAEQNP